MGHTRHILNGSTAGNVVHRQLTDNELVDIFNILIDTCSEFGMVSASRGDTSLLRDDYLSRSALETAKLKPTHKTFKGKACLFRGINQNRIFRKILILLSKKYFDK